ncbi:MAG: hypothetical protein ISR65_11045 [Bacteriovoracaceae bacterium]|nr:hypothetical protein [Bacteriovoracaceae bacterium]
MMTPKNNPETLESDSTNSTNNPTPEDAPPFANQLNYLQSGAIKSSNVFTLAANFNDSFYLRGESVDKFIRNGNRNIVQCLAFYFPTSLNKNFLIVAGAPESFNDPSASTEEFYYKFSPALESSNQQFCQKTGLINYVEQTYPGATVAYSLGLLCPSCTTSSYLSSYNVSLLNPDGHDISAVEVSYLQLKITMAAAVDRPIGTSCSESSACIAQGYHCCSGGQCVIDGQVKLGVDQSGPEYLQSRQDIQYNGAKFSEYPHFYYSCAITIIPPPTPAPAPNSEDEAQKWLQELTDLYHCTTTQKAEMSVCTVVYENPDPNGVYTTSADDRNFNYTYSGVSEYIQAPFSALPNHSIVEIIYASEFLYKDREFKFSPVGFDIGDRNDVLSDPLKIFNLTHPISGNPANTDLIIRYKIDGSCEYINSKMSKCTKYYIQGQNIGELDDHYPASNTFKLPEYADVSKNIRITVDGDPKLMGTHWNMLYSSPPSIQFTGATLAVYDTQQVKITFYVDTQINPVMNKKLEALNKIDEFCNCGGPNCKLKPVKSTTGEVINYLCDYPEPDTPIAPRYQRVLVSGRSAPVRFFDRNGVYQKVLTPESVQEGLPFSYQNGDLLKPNNTSTYVGFNEIYGSISSSPLGTQAATEVPVKKGTTYDIYTISGGVENCHYCGNDYYSAFLKLFPNTSDGVGGGYTPDVMTTKRDHTGPYRADDLNFGRACFVPATMIPWTHNPTSADRQQQRLDRLSAQHFLFANGYQRDWYGFDYGSIIGSFDGVLWFSVGNKRRIKAKSNKLFLAVNTYFHDLNTQGDFTLTVSEATGPVGSDVATTDYESDGAQCQKVHSCDTDSDCYAKFGADYFCQNIGAITTPWPVFDDNGLEQPGAQQVSRLSILSGIRGGSSKRCVYRGAGVPCLPNYNLSSASSSYAQITDPKAHACSSNNYCQEFYNGIQITKFNDSINRFGKSVQFQNATYSTEKNTFGLSSPIIGRPSNYNGTKPVNSATISSLYHNLISSICIPGREPNNRGETIVKASSYPTSNDFLGDQFSGIGMTPSSTDLTAEYLSSCGIFDTGQNYFFLQSKNFDKKLNNSELTRLAGSQAIASNSLKIFETVLGPGTDIITKYRSSWLTGPIVQQNRCLKAPGATCHTDMDCAPSEFISQKLTSLNADDSSLSSILNKYEIKFWQEGLTCASENSTLTANRCCRQTGKTLSIASFQAQTALIDNQNVPGIGISLTDPKRYSRISTVYKELQDGEFSPLVYADDNQCGSSSGCANTTSLTKQYKTFAAIAERTCCSKHWIRNFHSDENSGGHTWGPTKTQSIDKTTFKCLNWLKCNLESSTGAGDNNCSDPTDGSKFDCSHTPLDPSNNPKCTARATSNGEALKVFQWLNTLELLGVPQIAIKSDSFSEIECLVDPSNQAFSPGAVSTTAAGIKYPLPDTVVTKTSDNVEYLDSSGNFYFSSTDKTNFRSNLKMIFSKDTISCCIGIGETTANSDDECCSGFKNPQDGRCALPDYTNVSLYFNRYISSEAKDLHDNLFDNSGYFTSTIENPSTKLQTIACLKHACASNTMAQGVVLSNLLYPGAEDSGKKIRRYIDNDSRASNVNGIAQFYDAGLRWNNNLYCVPANTSEAENLHLIKCDGY